MLQKPGLAVTSMGHFGPIMLTKWLPLVILAIIPKGKLEPLWKKYCFV